MIFKHELKYQTRLEINEINSRLSSITQRYYQMGWSENDRNYKFEGKINRDGFKISSTFLRHSHREILLYPEVTGTYLPKENHTEIKLQFSIPAELKNILIAILVLNLTLMVLMNFYPILRDFPFFGKWWVYLIYIILTILIFFCSFTYKVYKTEKLLGKLLELKQSILP